MIGPSAKAHAGTFYEQPLDTVEIRTAEEQFRVMRVCHVDEPVLKEVSPGHWASCHFAENYAKAPVTRPILNHRREVVPELEAVDGGIVG